MINWLLTLLGAVVLSIVGREATGWIWQLSLWVARRAAAAMPGSLAGEYEDTYLGELEILRDRPLTAVIVSLRMLKGSGQTAAIRVSGRPSPAALAIKTVIDFTAALLLIIVLAPVMIVTGVAILLTMGSPVVVRQERVGRGGSTFHLLKFRTVAPDRRLLPQDFIGEDWRGTHKHPRDPRITRLGRFLRTWSLDELPQFVNVIRGEMSLVGPRPERVEIVARYQPWQHARHEVKPGITGLWQVSSHEGSEGMSQKDQEYVRKWSLGLDLFLLLITPLAALGLRLNALSWKALIQRACSSVERRRVLMAIAGVSLIVLVVLGILRY